MPPGLPAPLRAFISSGGKLEAPSDTSRRPSLGAPAAASAHTSSSVASPKMSVTDAFAAVSTPVVPTTPDRTDGQRSNSLDGGSLSTTATEEVTQAVMDLSDVSKKLVGSNNSAMEVALRIPLLFLNSCCLKYCCLGV